MCHIMKTSSVWITFAVAIVVVEGYYYTPFTAEPLAAFDHQEDYFIGDPYYPLDTGLYQSHPFESYEQSPTIWDLFQQNSQYMNFEAPPNSLINYIPVKPGSWITPNVYVKGRGYTTDRYVAPTMLEKYLAMSPR